MQCEQALAQGMTAIVPFAAGLLENGNSCALGEPAHRGGKIQVLVVHDETKNRPACTAAEAMIRLALRVDVKGGRLFAMKRTQSPPASPGALKWKIGANDLDNVIRLGDALDGFLGDARHKAQNTLRANLARGRFLL